MNRIAHDALEQKLVGNERVTLIDVRDPHEYEKNRIEPEHGHSINIPYRAHDTPATMADKIPDEAAEPFYIICWSGVCSQRVAKALEEEGYETVSVDGGMKECKDLSTY